MAIPNLYTVKAFAEKHKNITTAGGLRSLIFFSKENGFDQCIIRMGRKILINEDAFFNWLDKQSGGNKL